MHAWTLHPRRSPGANTAAATAVDAFVAGDQVLLVLGGTLGADVATDMAPLREWLRSAHCTEVLVDAAAVEAVDDAVVTALRQIVQLVRIGGGDVTIVAASPRFRLAGVGRLDG